MARSNTGSVANWLSNATTPITANPVSMSCWFYPASLTSTFCLAAIEQATVATFHALMFDGSNAYALGAARVVIDNAGSNQAASASAVASINTWNHAGSVNASNTSRIAYLNGVAGTTTTGSAVPSTYDHVNIGAVRNATTTFYALNGRVAEVGMWNVALTAAEMLSLSKGCSPLLIRPNNLLRYWPLYGRGTETCIVSGQALIVSGTIAQAAHAPMLTPQAPFIGIPAAAAAGPIAGSLAVTVEPVSVAANADLLVQGSFNTTIEEAVLVASGSQPPVSGSFAVLVEALALAASGDVDIKGQLAVSINAISQSADADLIIQAQFSQTLGIPTLAASADLIVQGQLAQTIAPVTQNASAGLIIQAQLAQTVAPVTQTAAADIDIKGTFGVTVDQVSMTASGDVDIRATASQSIDPVTLAASAMLTTPGAVTGNFGVSIEAVSQVAAGTVTIRGTLAQTIAEVTLAATGVLAVLAAITGTFGVTIFEVTLSASGSATLPEVPEAPRIPYWGPPSSIPEKQLKKAVRKLLAREAAARAAAKPAKRPKALAKALLAEVARIAPAGLGKPEIRGLIGFIAAQMPTVIPDYFAAETIYDKGLVEKALLALLQQAILRLAEAEEEDDEEAALLLLSAA